MLAINFCFAEVNSDTIDTTIDYCPNGYEYPKVIGGGEGNTYIEHIDYCKASNSLVAVGYTYDDSLRKYT
jgi:hypothetical protein